MVDDIHELDGTPLAQGYAKPATAEDLIKDAAGVTYPNIHRRINTDLARLTGEYDLTTPDGELLTTPNGDILTVTAEYGPGGAQSFALLVQGVDSFRTTTPLVYHEDSDDSEVP